MPRSQPRAKKPGPYDDLDPRSVAVVFVVVIALVVIYFGWQMRREGFWGSRGTPQSSPTAALRQFELPPDSTNLVDLRRAVDAGNGCRQLIEIKDAMNPKSADYMRAPAILRNVGCYNVESQRTDR